MTTSAGPRVLVIGIGNTYRGDDAGLDTLYPGYSSMVRGKELVNWPAQPWIQTGNSIPAPGEVCTVARNLNTPFLGKIFFAGEQSSPGFYGYMEGALQAGLRAANQIAMARIRFCQSRGLPTHETTAA